MSKQPIILYILIGLLIFAIAIGPIYNAITSDDSTQDDPNGSTLNYDDFSHLSDWGELGTLGEEKPVFVYRYAEWCGYCGSIEEEILSFADDNNEDIVVFMVNVDEIEGTLPSGLERGVPSMLVIDDGTIVDERVGPGAIRNLFSTVNDGNFNVD